MNNVHSPATNYSILIGFYTFYLKEIKRFMRVWGQTIVGPIITTSLFLLVFVVSIGSVVNYANSPYTYAQFIVPGLIMMAVIQNSFANSSSSIVIAKINGNIVDILMAPLTPSLIVLGYLLGGITRGLLVSVCLLLFLLMFLDIRIHNVWWMVYFVISAASLLSLLGLIAGIISYKFDQLAHFTNLIITPLSFLSGTFYSIKQLPENIQFLAHYNPFFYMIDGFRYSFIGVSDMSILLEALVLMIINIGLFMVSVILWKKGYRIKN